jgi:hypothetical protein
MKLEILAQVLSFVINTTGLPPVSVEELPEIIPVTVEEMTEIGCQRFNITREGCESWKNEAKTVQAMFIPSLYKVYYQAKYDFENSRMARSYLAHELTHVLQFKAGVLKIDTCDDLYAAEVLAYQVQDKYLGGDQPIFTRLFRRSFRCTDKDQQGEQ